MQLLHEHTAILYNFASVIALSNNRLISLSLHSAYLDIPSISATPCMPGVLIACHARHARYHHAVNSFLLQRQAQTQPVARCGSSSINDDATDAVNRPPISACREAINHALT